MMNTFLIGLSLLFFLPVIESFNREIAFNLLLSASLLLSISTFWKRKLLFDFIDLLWVLILLIFTISTLASWSISRSYIELLRYFAYFLIFVAIRYHYQLQDLLKRFFVPMVVTNSIILSFLFIISRFLNLPQPENKMSLFDPFYMGHNHLADILIFTIPIVFFLQKKYLSIVLSLFFILILVLTQSRGAMVSLSVAFLVYIIATKLWQNPHSHSRESGNQARSPIKSGMTLILLIVTIIFLLASFIYSNFLVSEGTKEGFLRRFYKPVEKENRFEYLSQAWEGFSVSPIFGTGLDTFRYVSKIYQSAPNTWSWYAHNHFAQLFTETGFLGGILFSALIITLLLSAFKSLNYQLSIINYQFHGLFIALTASTLHSLIDFDWQYISIFLLFFISAAFLTAKKVDKNGKKYYILPRILIFISFLLFLLPSFITLDSDRLITEADKTVSENNLDKAENILLQTFKFDSKNQEISEKLADLAVMKGSSDSAHLWFKNAILLDPYYSEKIIKKDVRIYMTQAKTALDKNDFKTSNKYILQSVKTYPLFYQTIGGEFFLFNADKLTKEKRYNEAKRKLLDYINLINKQINTKKLLPEEILSVADNLKRNVY